LGGDAAHFQAGRGDGGEAGLDQFGEAAVVF
jgi:hypothetical protein